MCIKCQLKNKYRQANSYLLPAVSLSCQSYYSRDYYINLSCLLPFPRFLPYTHLHTYTISKFSLFKMLGFLNFSSGYQHILICSNETLHTYFFTLEALKTKISTTKLVQE